MDGLETRELAYFVAVAEELHFGRAARRLGIAQPPLSRAIKQIEHRVGVPLLVRSSRHVQLTPAGAILLHEARKALDAVAAATRRARRAGEARQRLVVVTKPGGDAGLLPAVLAAYEAEPGMPAADVLLCGYGEQATLLRDGRADVALLHRPWDDLSGFDTEDLLVQRQVAVLPRPHRLAARPALTLADLAGEPRPRWPGVDPPDGPGEPDGPVGPSVRDGAQLLELVALGRVVALLPDSIRDRLRPDLVCVPVLDAPMSTLLVAWPERSRSLATAAFVRAALAAAARSTVDNALIGSTGS
jgi:DNA-binding transcriptional LysR family regulator